jgi:hypothetical protein
MFIKGNFLNNLRLFYKTTVPALQNVKSSENIDIELDLNKLE